MDKSEIKLLNSQNEIFNRLKSLQATDDHDQQSMRYFLFEPLDFLVNTQNQLYNVVVSNQGKSWDATRLNSELRFSKS